MSKPQAQREKLHRSGSKSYGRRPSSETKNGFKSSGNGNGTETDKESIQQDRMVYLIKNSIGADVNVLLNSGSRLTGTLENIDTKTLNVVLKTAHETTTVKYEDVIDFEILSVDLFNNSIVKNSASFKTDTDISTKGNTQRRQDIEKWVPDSSASMGLSLEDISLEDGHGKGKWDQFQTNERKFGIKSEFDEHLYTTKINKNDPDYQKRLKEADRLAKEIENGITENSHLAEERGIKFDDSGIDEEDKYSGVARKPSTAKGDALFASLINKSQDNKNMSFEVEEKSSKYVPPSQRSRLQNIDPSIISATNIQTSKKSPSPSPTPQQQQQQPPAVVEPKTAKPVASKPSLPAKPVQAAQDKARAYEQVKKLNAMNEINSLKEFSQNFKLPSKFPQDLLPIITKDKSKQEEIIKKSEATSKKPPPKATNAPTTKSADGSSSAIKPSTPVVTSTPPSTTTGVKRADTIKKLNPKAAAFTPSGFASPGASVATPHFSKNSPRLSQVSYRQKKFNQPFFSPDRLPSADKKRALEEDFNFFKGKLKEHKSNEERSKTEFVLEKPFMTPPTWSRDDLDRPFKKFFPDIDFSKVMPTPLQQQHQQQHISPYQTMPMMQPPQMFYSAPQFPTPMRMSPQSPQPVLAHSDGNFMQPQRMQPMYIQPGMPMNGPAPIQYQRYPQGGYGHPQGAPIPQMMPPPNRIQTGYKNHN